MKILAIESITKDLDNLKLCLCLAWSNESVICCTEMAQGLSLLEQELPEIVLLSLDSTEQEGFESIRHIRAFSDVPLIAVSMRQTDFDKAHAFDLGADDYITKPIVFIDLISRIKAVLRRTQNHRNSETGYMCDNLRISYNSHDVFVAGQPVKLSPTEYNLLCTLIRNEGKVLSHGYLLERALGPEYKDNTEDLKVWMHRLRTKLKDGENAAPKFKNQRGVGYIFQGS